MAKPRSKRLQCLIAALLCSASGASLAASGITRLTPPSDPGLAPQVVISRFLPGQRFDLQATVQPDAGLTVTQVSFAVDGTEVIPSPGASSLVTTGLNSGLAAGTAVASIRAYSNAAPGIHTLVATAKLSDGSTVSKTGNFEVVGITQEGRLAKNIIILLGDGMGAAHRTAARIVSQGYSQGKAKSPLAMDTFPFTGMVMTSSLNSIVTDSAPGMSNYVTGNKAQNNQEGVWPDDTKDAFDNPRFEYLAEYLHRTQGKSLGIVTTADVFDATPAANAVHTSNRGAGTGIVDQYLDDRGLTGLSVLMGGGRKWFLPNATNAVQPVKDAGGNPVYNLVNGSQRTTGTDYILPADIVAGWGAASGAKDSNRDLIADFESAGFDYASDKSGLDSATGGVVPKKLLGLFAFSNMNVSMDKIAKRRNPGMPGVVDDYGFPDQPMLDEMAAAALKVLAKNENGFIAMIEGASIDKQAHLMDTDRWILEAIEFDHAVQVAKDFAKTHPDTLVIVTADHECSGAAIIGAATVSAQTLAANAQASPTGTGTKTSLMRDGSPNAAIPPGGTPANPVVGNYDAAKFPAYEKSLDGFPATTDINYKMLIGYGANADRYETWLSNPQPTQDSQQPFAKPGLNNPYPNLSAYPPNPNVRNSASGFFITGQVPGEQAVHTATDIPLSALGRGSYLFTGVMDNTDVFFKLAQAAIGGAKGEESREEEKPHDKRRR